MIGAGNAARMKMTKNTRKPLREGRYKANIQKTMQGKISCGIRRLMRSHSVT